MAATRLNRRAALLTAAIVMTLYLSWVAYLRLWGQSEPWGDDLVRAGVFTGASVTFLALAMQLAGVSIVSLLRESEQPRKPHTDASLPDVVDLTSRVRAEITGLSVAHRVLSAVGMSDAPSMTAVEIARSARSNIFLTLGCLERLSELGVIESIGDRAYSSNEYTLQVADQLARWWPAGRGEGGA